MATLNHIPSIGQSNVVGTIGTPALSTAQTFGNKMFTRLAKDTGSSGVRMPQERLITLAELTTNEPLIETDTKELVGVLDGANHYTGANYGAASDYGETHCHGMGDMISTLIPGWTGLFSVAGRGGVDYSQIKDGDVFDNCWKPVHAAQNQLGNAGWIYTDQKVRAFVIRHGESDYHNPLYAGQLNTLHTNLNAKFKGLTGQSEDSVMIQAQASFETERISAFQQYYACRQNPNIVIASPTYPFPHSANHLTNVGHRAFGWYAGKAAAAIYLGTDWSGLQPVGVSRVGAVIRVRTIGRVGALVKDVSQSWGAITNSGMEYSDDTSSASISTVNFDGNDIVITLTAVPTGGDRRIKYATTQYYGNIRDSDPTLAPDGTTVLPNWLQHFDLPVTYDQPVLCGVWEC